MKRLIVFQTFVSLLLCINAFAANGDLYVNGTLGVGTTTPNASSALQVNSTTRGILPPRMTTAQRNAISSPVDGLFIYNTTTEQYECYNGTTASWNAIGGGPAVQNNLTASRQNSENVVYQNTTGKPLYVSIMDYLPSLRTIYAYSDANNPPTTLVAGNAGSYTLGISFVVLPGNYYKFYDNYGAVSIGAWIEWH